MECTYKPESFLLDRACKVQSSKQGRLFCEFSATQLRQLRGIYCNFTESDGSEDSGHCYFMPKLQTLLSVFREFAYSQHGKEYLFIELIFHFLNENQNRRLAKWIFLHFLSQFDIFFSNISPDCVPNLIKILTMRLCVKFQNIHCP